MVDMIVSSLSHLSPSASLFPLTYHVYQRAETSKIASTEVHTDATSCMALRRRRIVFAHPEKSTERRLRLDPNMIRRSDDFAWRAGAHVALWSFLCAFMSHTLRLSRSLSSADHAGPGSPSLLLQGWTWASWICPFLI
jgi:hypothetical protein